MGNKITVQSIFTVKDLDTARVVMHICSDIVETAKKHNVEAEVKLI